MKKNHTTMSQIKSQEMHLLSKCYECYKTISSKKQSEHSKTVDFLFKRLQFMAKGGRQIRRFCSFLYPPHLSSAFDAPTSPGCGCSKREALINPEGYKTR